MDGARSARTAVVAGDVPDFVLYHGEKMVSIDESYATNIPTRCAEAAGVVLIEGEERKRQRWKTQDFERLYKHLRIHGDALTNLKIALATKYSL